jgi:glycine/D-amino acid oxidase-like deaminating enzyme
MVRLARDGQVAYRNWPAFTGLANPRNEFTETGVLWLMGKTKDEVLADLYRLTDANVAAMMLDADGVAERFPALSTCAAPSHLPGDTDHACSDLEAALLEVDGGYADPSAADADLIEAARCHGAEVRFNTPVVAVRVRGDRVLGVDLADGEQIDAPVVINAAGPWCNRLNAYAGVATPWTLRPTRVQVVYRSLADEVPPPIPVTVDAAGGIYFRPEARGRQILFGSVLPEDESEPADPDDYKTVADTWFKDLKIHALHHRIPSLPHRGTLTGIAGLYTVNEEDVHPVVGPWGPDGWYLANGFSGHGFKLAPMIGSMVAQDLTGIRAPFDTDVPISFLAVDRKPLSVAEKSVLA